MEKEYVEDWVYGARLLISTDADKTELQDNIRCARTLLEAFPDMTIAIRRNVLEFRFKNPEHLINGEIGDRKGIHSERGIAYAFKRGVKQGCKNPVNMGRKWFLLPRYTTKKAEAIKLRPSCSSSRT